MVATKIDKELFARLWADGYSHASIAEYFGVTTGRLRKVRSAMGLPQRVSTDPRLDSEIVRMRASGASYDSICKSLQTSKATVSRVLQQHHMIGERVKPHGIGNAEWCDRLRELCETGTSVRDMAEALRCHEATVRKHMKALGLRRRIVPPGELNGGIRSSWERRAKPAPAQPVKRKHGGIRSAWEVRAFNAT